MKKIIILVIAILLIPVFAGAFSTGFMCSLDGKIHPANDFQTNFECTGGNHSCCWYLLKKDHLAQTAYGGIFGCRYGFHPDGSYGKVSYEMCLRVVGPKLIGWVEQNYPAQKQAATDDVAKMYEMFPLEGEPDPPVVDPPIVDPPIVDPPPTDCSQCESDLVSEKAKLKSIKDRIQAILNE